MGKETITSDNIAFEKQISPTKKASLIYDVDIKKIVLSSKFHFNKKGFKYFIDSKDMKKVKNKCI